jgi:hypothetical protein
VSEVRLYFEGSSALKRGFRVFFRKIAEAAENKRVRFNLIDTDGKPESDFRKGRKRNPDAWNILLRDSEGPVDPARSDDSVYWMVQLMEAWFLADPEAMEAYYGSPFAKTYNPRVEEIPKADVLARLKDATRHTQKGSYHKTKHAPHILERLDPTKVRTAAPNCERLFRELLAKLL